MTTDKNRHLVRTSLITAIAPCIWGSTYIVTTQMLPPNHPLTAALLRVLPIGLVMIALQRRAPTGEWWGRLLFLGLLNIGVFQALLFIAAYRLPGGVAATVIATQPLAVIVLSRPLLNSTPTRLAWIAAGTGVVGVALLVLTPAARLDAMGLAAAFAGAGCMALGTVLTKRWAATPLPIAAFTGWQLVFGGLFLLPFALFFEEPLAALSVKNVLGYAYLGVFGTGITYMIFFWGIRRLQPSAVSLLGLLSPVMATALGFLVLGQSLTPLQIVGGVLVLWSIWAGQRPAPARR
ncbi:EamA family transporter [Geomonas anaerohicana]|uniref:EamA family transporter n=1 Tax=Geomonas anaerohicana TaxID=2798583 RepID=A0ABS0YFR2_9BACT|nr:EamA family transporter [Geomonas anaerohicana]MBJ6751116.1 EamA family transporter [Geomonas anaerohicana]